MQNLQFSDDSKYCNSCSSHIVKFLASLQLGIKNEPEKIKRNVVILVPCYSEDKESLKRSIDSIANLEYENRRKILVMIADRNVTGR